MLGKQKEKLPCHKSSPSGNQGVDNKGGIIRGATIGIKGKDNPFPAFTR
jgi:hypothetical protein